MSDLPDSAGDPEAAEEYKRPEEDPPEVEEGWEDEEPMDGEAPSG